MAIPRDQQPVNLCTFCTEVVQFLALKKTQIVGSRTCSHLSRHLVKQEVQKMNLFRQIWRRLTELVWNVSSVNNPNDSHSRHFFPSMEIMDFAIFINYFNSVLLSVCSSSCSRPNVMMWRDWALMISSYEESQANKSFVLEGSGRTMKYLRTGFTALRSPPSFLPSAESRSNVTREFIIFFPCYCHNNGL